MRLFNFVSTLAIVSFSMAGTAQAQTSDTATQEASVEPQDIIVTATKRSERLIEVPLSVSVVDSSTMASQNLVSVQDIVARIPGLAVSAVGGGRVQIAIRGITTGGLNNTTVGITVDDVPIGGTTNFSYGSWLVPELDPAVIRQVEVLRGPQGTLYGAASLGGLMRYVTASPRFDRLSGSVSAGAKSVSHGEAGFGVRGALNVPLGSNVAVLANGYFRRDPGYVDDASRGLRNINRADNWGGRVALGWEPADTLSVKLAALLQKVDGDGTSQIDADSSLQPLAGYNQSNLVSTGPYSRKIQLYTSTIDLDLDFATLTSVTGYSLNDFRSIDDANATFESLARLATGRTDVGAISYFSVNSKKFSQELRLVSPSNQPLEWLIGAFYTNEKNNPFYNLVASDLATGEIVDEFFPDRYPNSYKEYAAFASLTYHFNDRFDLQVGGRYGHNKQVFDESITGPFYDPPYSVHAESDENVFTYSVTPRFRINPDMTLYGRVASGYRPGGPNPGAGFGFPATYSSDSTVNYEIGYKASLFDRMLSLEASIYRIDWKDIQLQQVDPDTSLAYYVNASKARSRGFELLATLRPLETLTFVATLGYTDAELAEDAPFITGSPTKGAPLPLSAPWSSSLAVDHDIPVSGDTTASLGFTISYLDGRRGNFASDGQARYPAFTTADLRASLKRDGWKLSAFASNIFDKRVAVGGARQSTGSPVFAININRPRTIGLDLSRSF